MTYIRSNRSKIKIQKTTSPITVYPVTTDWQMISDSVITYSCDSNASYVLYSHVFQLEGLPDAHSWGNIKIVMGETSASNTVIGDFTDITIESKDYGFTQGGTSSYRSSLVKSEFVIDTWVGSKKIGLAIGLWNSNNEMGLNGMGIYDNSRYYLSGTLLAGISNTIICSIR